MTRRLARLNKQLQREITRIVREQVRDPRVGLPTVTEVRVTNDLFLARVFVRVEGDDAERAQAFEGLEAASPFIRKTLGGELHIRRVPELRFQEDRSVEHASRIDEILREVLPGTEGSEDSEGIEDTEGSEDTEDSEDSRGGEGGDAADGGDPT